MTLTALKKTIAKSLHQQVILNLNSGDYIPLLHPEFASLSPDKLSLFVWEADGGFEVVTVTDIIGASVTPKPTEQAEK